MTILQAIFLGIVQGITEFLPVSSSGHLTILSVLFGIDTPNKLLFEVLLHCGTVVAICLAFHKDILRLLYETVGMLSDLWFNAQAVYHNNRNREAKRYKKIVKNNYRSFVVMILVSSIPTAIIGYYSRELVELSSQNLLVPGICFLITALMLLIADISESGQKIPKDIGLSSAFLIGIAQGVAVLPGLSRSGVTIAACLLSGYDKRFAVRYSFIMSIPVIIGAMIPEIQSIPGSGTTVSDVFIYLSGAIISGGVGYFCIRKMIGIVRRKSFKGFAAYCLAVGILALAGFIGLR